MKTFCSNCGNEVSEKTRFCDQCGMALYANEETSETVIIDEPAVKEDMPAEESFAEEIPAEEISLAEEISEDEQPANGKTPVQQSAVAEKSPVAQAPTTQKISFKQLLMMGIAAVVVLAVILCAALLGPRAAKNTRVKNYIKHLCSTTYILEEDKGLPTHCIQYLTFDAEGICSQYNYFSLGNNLLKYEAPYAIITATKTDAQIIIGGKEYRLNHTKDNTQWSLCDEENGKIFTQSYAKPDQQMLVTDTYEHIEKKVQEELQRKEEEKAQLEALLKENEEKASWLLKDVRISPLSEYTMSMLLYYVCKDYTIDCVPAEGSTTKFIFTINAEYYPNKIDLDFLTEHGTMVVEVDTETGECAIVEDTGILNAMQVYLALGTNWWYDELY